MGILKRAVRFYHLDSHEWTWGYAGVLGSLLWLYHDLRSLAFLLFGSTAAFIVPHYLRHVLIRNFDQVKRVLFYVTIAAIAGVLAAREFGHVRISSLVFVVYLAFVLGVRFWCVSDPMCEMIQWLTYPTEYGRPPDEIYLIDQRSIAWPGELAPVRCQLFRFRYGDCWGSGITGPLAFSLGEPGLDDESPEEIYAAYARWYEREGIGRMVQQFQKRDS